MYHGITIRLYHALDQARLGATLRRLRAAGADAVSLVPHQYCLLRMDPGNPKHDALPAPTPLAQHADQYVFADLDEGGKLNVGLVGNTTPLADVRTACQMALDAGLQPLLKPHVDPLYWHSGDRRYYPGGWRGSMEVKDIANSFLRSYCLDFLAPYVGIARDLKLPLLSIGVEYVQITRDAGAGFWTAVADWVGQQGYSGALTYSANWGWGADAEFRRLDALWRHPQVAFIGVDAYYPLWPIQLTDAMLASGWSPAPDSPDANPTVAQLVSGWTSPHITPNGQPIDVAPADGLTVISRTVGKPLLFTEIGYANRRGAAWEPGRDPTGDEAANPAAYLDDPHREGCLQERLFQAFRQVWAASDSFGGYFWWDAALDPAQDPCAIVTHNVLDPCAKPPTRLEALLFRDFAPTGDPAALRLRGAPTISKAKFAEVLQGAGSPVLQEAPADTYYDLIVSYGIDPAVALAFFALESGYGTVANLAELRNWGMLWSPQTAAWAHYQTWRAGLLDWLQRVQGPAYLKSGEPTLASMVKIYQPSGLKRFNNDTTLYSDAAGALIASWQA
jgi:hypothetical protein